MFCYYCKQLSSDFIINDNYPSHRQKDHRHGFGPNIKNLNISKFSSMVSAFVGIYLGVEAPFFVWSRLCALYHKFAKKKKRYRQGDQKLNIKR